MATGMPRLPHPKARSRVKAAVILLTAGLLHIPTLFTPVPFRLNPVHAAQRARTALAGEVAVLSNHKCKGCAQAFGTQEHAQFEEFAQRAGPPAVEKVRKFAELLNESRDLFPERIKLQFQQEGGSAEDPLIWCPRQQHLLEIFLDFEHIVYDFNLKYQDEDDEQVVLRPSKGAVEAMVESMAGKPARIAVIWRSPNPTEGAKRETQEVRASTHEGLKKAKMWITGGGKVSDKDVSEAEKQVEKCGGRIVVPKQNKESLVRYQGTDLDKWASVCENLQSLLDLSEDEAAMLKNAEYTNECEAFVTQDWQEGPVHSTRVVAYRTVRDVPRNMIHVVYGRHEASMQAASQALNFPLNNCIKLGDRTFTALPPTSPHANRRGTDMVNNPFEIPAGWVPVKASDPAIASILNDVVVPYCWGTDVVVLKGGDGAWEGFRTASWTSQPIASAIGKVSCLQAREGRYVFTDQSYRLLVEAVPTKSPQLLNNWKRCVKLSAEADWARRLNIEDASDEQLSSH